MLYNNSLSVKKIFAVTFLVIFSLCSLSLAKIEPTKSTFTSNNSTYFSVLLRPTTTNVYVQNDILDGKCAIFTFSPYSGYKKITLQISQSANMSNPATYSTTLSSTVTNIRVTNLLGKTTYYVRARVDDSHKIEYGPITSFTTAGAIPPGQIFDCLS